MRTTKYFLAVVLILAFSGFVTAGKYADGSADNFKVNEDSIQPVAPSEDVVQSPMTGIPHISVVWGAFSSGSF